MFFFWSRLNQWVNLLDRARPLAVNRQGYITLMLTDCVPQEEMQKAAFQALQLQKDSVHGYIRSQVSRQPVQLTQHFRETNDETRLNGLSTELFLFLTILLNKLNWSALGVHRFLLIIWCKYNKLQQKHNLLQL